MRKIHARPDGQGRPLCVVLAEKGYDDEARTALPMKGLLPVMPSKSNRRESIACDFKVYQDRNRIERMLIASSRSATSYLGLLILVLVKL